MKMNKVVLGTVSLGIVVSLVGCSSSSHQTNSQQSQKQQKIVIAPTKSEPKGLDAHLSPFSARVTKVTHLPLEEQGNSVLYIEPSLGYAVKQLATVWGDIKVKPTVVWIGFTQANTEANWKAMGYSSNPLPAPNTQFTTQAIATPDSYVKVRTQWYEFVGIPKQAETNDWSSFFNGQVSFQSKTSTKHP